MSSNFLEIFSTTRAIRSKKESFLNRDSFLPKMITIYEFENRSIRLGNRVVVPNLLRALYLKEAANFNDLAPLKLHKNLIKFYTNAQDFFRFFEEVVAEGVDINSLYLADSYAEFDRDLELLDKLLTRYKKLLDRDGFIDKIFIPKEYSLNIEYINSFDGFILNLDGYLTNFELELFNKIAKLKPFTIRVRTTPFNKKVIDSFKEFGVDLPINSFVEFDLHTKEINKVEEAELNIDAEVIEVGEHLEQISIAFAKIEEMVNSGIKPENIALIVPDESIVPILKRFDRLKNLNFAMGISYKNYSSYKILEQISNYLRGDSLAKEFLTHNKIDIKLIPINSMGVEEFFDSLQALQIEPYSSFNLEKELDRVSLREKFYNFKKIFKSSSFEFANWLFLWLSELKEHSLDDVAGGKITVIGLLESRGVEFDGVVIIDFNDGVVPSISNKDRFLNSAVRSHAKLPTRADRENLQKHYYARVLEGAKRAVIVYSSSDNAQPSKFLYELNLTKANRYKSPLNLLFDLKSSYNSFSHLRDLEVAFDAKTFTWSSQSLKSFLECKRKFYYRYIKQITEPSSQELNEGRVLHEILARVIKAGSSFSSKDELKKALAKELAKYKKDDSELLYKKPLWIDMLDGFIENQIEHFAKGWQVKRCEFGLSGEIDGLKFTGRVDRLDVRDGINLIIDYKSGSIKKANLKDVTKIEDFQMSIYAKLLDKPKMDFMFIELLNDGKESYLDNPKEKDEMLIEHIGYLKSIKSFKSEQCEDLQKCRYCPYQLLCHRGEYL